MATAAVERVEVEGADLGLGLGLEGIGVALGVEGLVPEREGEWEVRLRRAGDRRICAPWLCIIFRYEQFVLSSTAPA